MTTSAASRIVVVNYTRHDEDDREWITSNLQSVTGIMDGLNLAGPGTPYRIGLADSIPADTDPRTDSRAGTTGRLTTLHRELRGRLRPEELLTLPDVLLICGDHACVLQDENAGVFRIDIERLHPQP